MYYKNVLLTAFAMMSCALAAQTYIPMPVSQNPPFEVSTNEVFVEFVSPSMTIGGSVVVTGGSGNYSYRWYSGSEEIGSEASITIDAAGVYDLRVSDTCDCMQQVRFTVTSASVEGLEAGKAAVYPNPVADRLVVRGEDIKQVCVVSAAGALVAVRTGFEPGSQVDIDMSMLPAGEYIVNCVTTRHNVLTRKIVKQ